MRKNHRNIITKIMALVIGSMLLHVTSQAQERSLDYYMKKAPFIMPKVKVPEFQDKVFNVTEYGAVGDGQTMNTQAFAAAINACNEAGGGKVVVPPGLWITGPIQMKSNVNLHVERGALVQFTSDHTQYPMVKASASSSRYVTASPIYGYKVKNIAITGKGIIDGAGETWRPVKKAKMTDDQWKDLVKSGGVVSKDGKLWWPSKEAIEGKDYLKSMKKKVDKPGPIDYIPARDYMRPYMVYLVDCENLLIENITLRNSPKFVVYPNNCQNVTIRHANVYNDWWSQNGDGVDISACKNVVVYQCNINVGDDGICMKSSGDGPESGTYNVENVLIAGCNVYHAHGGFVVGSNTNGNVRNVFVNDCNFVGTDIGIRMKSTAGKGGIVENIFIKDIYMTGIKGAAISFDTFYQNVPAGTKRDTSNKLAPHDIPVFRNYHISNVYCLGAGQSIYMSALPDSPIQDIYMDNVWIKAKKGADMTNVDRITLKNVKTDIQQGPVYRISDGRDVTIDNGYMPKSAKVFIEASGDTKGISVVNTSVPGLKDAVKTTEGATSKAVQFK
ncbi:glycoside hydrolase family 28 protein [Prolixibacter bellariivorans]|nr:glycoside hydrolase family 28 protein [Prolixibacter bellariivorans]